MDRVCYVINFYFGKRRKSIDRYNHIDRLCFVRKQLELLTLLKHNLNSIIFNFNVDPEHYSYLNEAIKLVPKNINSTKIEINVRENVGISYGAWSDVFSINRDKYDYFLFSEDDVFFIEDNFDSTLIRKFNSYPNCGCLGMMIRPAADWNQFKIHSGHHAIVSSNKILSEVYNRYGELPYAKSSDYTDNELNGQIEQSYVFTKLGYKLYDIRDEYMVQMESPYDSPEEIHRYFDWNNKEIIQPAKIVFGNNSYSFWVPLDESYSKDYLTKLYAQEKETASDSKAD